MPGIGFRLRAGLRATAAALPLALPALPAAAQGGLPQLDANSFAPQLIWLAITFVLLYLLMSRLALPRISEVLEQRQQRIADDLDQAEALKQQTDKAIAEYQAALAEARARAQAIAAETRERTGGEAARERSAVEGQLAERTRAAEGAITAAKQSAMANLKGVAVDTARAAVQRLIGVEVTAAAVEAAVDAAMREKR